MARAHERSGIVRHGIALGGGICPEFMARVRRPSPRRLDLGARFI